MRVTRMLADDLTNLCDGFALACARLLPDGRGHRRRLKERRALVSSLDFARRRSGRRSERGRGDQAVAAAVLTPPT